MIDVLHYNILNQFLNRGPRYHLKMIVPSFVKSLKRKLSTIT